MKKYIFMLILQVSVLYSQKKQDTVNVNKDEFFIDYEKDEKWIKKVESFNVGSTELLRKNLLDEKEYFIHINKSSNISIEYNDIMSKHINRYVSYKWFPKILGLLEFYSPLFEMKLEQYGLPKDLKYLAIVESNLNPQAGSWAGASGLWQFMPLTGKQYGLAKNNKINLFYDPYLSTDAACRYLQRLYKMFGDWNLVLSAYNAGEGRILNAIKKAGTKNYWRVRNFLPNETKAYAPSFHAVRYVGKAYSLYYKSIPKLKYNYTHIKEVKIFKQTTFKEFALKNNLNLETLYFLNPHIVTEIIPAGGFLYYLENKIK